MTIKFGFPWSLYFRQLFAADTYVRLINPFNFWRKYRIKHLENCSELDSIEHLERCYQKKCVRAKTENCEIRPDPRVYKNSADSSPSIHCELLFIVQPSENLKYRGVEYRRTKIAGIYFDRIALDSNSNKQNYPLTDKKNSDSENKNNLETN